MLTATKENQDSKVAKDEELLPNERETYFHIAGDEKDTVKVTSNMKPVIEQMLKCDNLKVTRNYTDDQGNIIHLEGRLPVTHLRFKTEPKKSNYLSRVLV